MPPSGVYTERISYPGTTVTPWSSYGFSGGDKGECHQFPLSLPAPLLDEVITVYMQ